MLGFGAIGQLAIRQIPGGIQQVTLAATMRVSAAARVGTTAPAPISAKASIKARMSVLPGVNLGSKLHVATSGRATGGVALAAILKAAIRARAPGGVILPARLTAVSKAHALGGVALPARLRVSTQAHVLSGVNLASSIRARVSLRAPGGAAIPARIEIRVKGYADKFFVPGSGHNPLVTTWVPQPAYDVKPAKPFRPIWDRRRAEELEEIRRKAAQPPALPPEDIFGTPALISVELRALPDFGTLVPGDWREIETSVREAQDATDAEIVLSALVDTDATDLTDAVAALEAAADSLLTMAVQQARAIPQQREIAMPARIIRPGDNSYDDQMRDVTDHADAMATLRESGLLPDEA